MPDGRVPVFVLVVLALTLVGFAVTSLFGLSPAWAALAGAVVLGVHGLARGRSYRLRIADAVDIPFLAFVLCLGVVVAAVMHHGLDDAMRDVLPAGDTLPALLGIAAVAALLSNIVNNLPAVLVLLPLVAGPAGVLAVLIGVNVGPNLTYVGSLANLLWRGVVRRDIRAGFVEFTRIGLLKRRSRWSSRCSRSGPRSGSSPSERGVTQRIRPTRGGGVGTIAGVVTRNCDQGSKVALGDSFTEGVGDPHPGSPNGLRGWADRVAVALAQNNPELRYANLAVRGRRMDEIVAEQVRRGHARTGPRHHLCRHERPNGGARRHRREMARYADGLKALRQTGARCSCSPQPTLAPSRCSGGCGAGGDVQRTAARHHRGPWSAAGRLLAVRRVS